MVAVEVLSVGDEPFSQGWEAFPPVFGMAVLQLQGQASCVFRYYCHEPVRAQLNN